MSSIRELVYSEGFSIILKGSPLNTANEFHISEKAGLKTGITNRTHVKTLLEEGQLHGNL